LSEFLFLRIQGSIQQLLTIAHFRAFNPTHYFPINRLVALWLKYSTGELNTLINFDSAFLRVVGQVSFAEDEAARYMGREFSHSLA
jgi:hypothetical protein